MKQNQNPEKFVKNNADPKELFDLIQIILEKFPRDSRILYDLFLPINKHLIYCSKSSESNLIDISTNKIMPFVDLAVDDLASGFYFDKVYKSDLNLGVVWKEKKYINVDSYGKSADQQLSAFDITSELQYGKRALLSSQNYIYWALPIYRDFLHLDDVIYNLNLTECRDLLPVRYC